SPWKVSSPTWSPREQDSSEERGQHMNGTVAAITTRALLGRRRFAVLLPLPLLLVGLAALAHSLEPNPADWGEPIVVGLGFGAVLPLIAVLIGTGVLGSEIEDGTIVDILATPLPRPAIV